MRFIPISWHVFLRRHVVLALVACCCWASYTPPSKDQLTIVVTTSMLGDAVRNVVQECAKVIILMGPGVDPHTYKATPRDVKHLLHADLIFYNGLHLEGKMADMLQKLGQNKRVYAAGDALMPSQQLVDPNFSTGVDPHIWFDVRLWKQVVQYISNRLQAMDPVQMSHYRANTAAYLQQLDKLHQETWEAIQQIPLEQRVLITAHDAFGYFGRAYAIEVHGLQGISTASECGLKDVTDLVSMILRRKVRAVFLETSVSEKPLKAVVEGCHQQGHPVRVGGHLYSDALGQVGTPAGSYYGMMQANVATIVNALK